jgi:hypothetical protein
MSIVGNERDGLTILPVLLDAKGDFQLLRENFQITFQCVNANERIPAIVKFPISWDEGFDDAFARRVYVLIEGRLRFLSILGAAQASYPNESEPVRDDGFDRIDCRVLGQVKQGGEHLS